MRRKSLMVFLIGSLLVSPLSVAPALAKGPFDKECPRCYGTGQMSCTNCQGSGKITSTRTCQSCLGSGVVDPTVALKSMDGWAGLVGLDWAAFVKGVFHDEEDVGVYGKATAEVTTLTATYTDVSERTYFPPHEDVAITVTVEEIGFGEDWTYIIYLSEADEINCLVCDGSGAVFMLSNCPECGGYGWVTCPKCGGSGYVTNPVAIWVAVAGVAVVAAVAIAVVVLVKTKKAKLPTEVA